MTQRPKAITLDVDPDSLALLRAVLREWDLEATDGATAGSLQRDRKPGVADLLVVGARSRPWETLGLCRGLRGQAGRAVTPLLVLVPAGQEALVKAVLAAGADHCLVLPVRARDLAGVAAGARAGCRDRRLALDLGQDRSESAWQDDGGEA